ncbi:hypothetical protein [Chryseobacterium sp. Leaf394]|uniref:hypothetical protein n=1 Tax=Chryseobacterium sp. Leaf394 TaxID=1736361 RepID=UPI000A8E1CD6|nr:hypothetical protein [Chryseobacterium sp. Leaf394]
MKQLLTLMFAGSLLMQSCKDDCYTAPDPTVFEFVNSSGENLIQSGTLTGSKIVVQQDNGNGNFAGIEVEVRDDNRVLLKNVGIYEGTKNYNVYLTTEPVRTFNFRVSASKLTGDCDGFKIDHLNVENISSTKENGYYKISVD